MNNLDELCGQELENGTVRVRYIEDGSDVACIKESCACILHRGFWIRNIGRRGVDWIVTLEQARSLGLDIEYFQAKDSKGAHGFQNFNEDLDDR